MSNLQAAGVILSQPDGRVLLLQRSDGSGWCFPGGKVEEGETSMACTTRETFEETGLLLEEQALRPVSVVSNPDGFQFACYASTVPDFTPVLCAAEHSGYGWFQCGALPSPMFMQCADLIEQSVTVSAMDSAQRVDGNGWIEIQNNPLSRVGVFEYFGKHISPDLPPDEVFSVYHPAEELSDPETIKSAKLIPWIAGHTMLGKVGKVQAEEKGVGGVTGEQIYFKDGILYGNLKLFSKSHADLVNIKGFKELSLGYTSKCEYAPGEWNGQPYQYIRRQFRFNHTATVPEGRMGKIVSVLDSVTPEKGTIMDVKEEVTLPDVSKLTVEQLMELVKVIAPKIQEAGKMAELLGGKTEEKVEVKEEGEGVEAEVKTEDTGAEVKTTDEELEEKKKEEELVKVEDAAMHRAFKALSNRDALARKAGAVVGVFDASNMTERECAGYILKKVGITAAKGHEVTAASAYLDGVNKSKAAASKTVSVQDSKDVTRPAAVPAFLSNHLEA